MNAYSFNQEIFKSRHGVEPIARAGHRCYLIFILTGILIWGTTAVRAQTISTEDSLKLATTLDELIPHIQDQTTQQEFQTLWTGEALTLTQKLSLTDLFQKLGRSHSQQNNLATIIVYAQKNANIDSQKLTALLDVCQKLPNHYSPNPPETHWPL